MIIPKTTKEVVEAILSHKEFSISSLAREIKVDRSTIYRILAGEQASPLADARLLRLYITLNQQEK